jgi:hypothetical protein
MVSFPLTGAGSGSGVRYPPSAGRARMMVGFEPSAPERVK